MSARRLHGIIYAAARSANADEIVPHAGLGLQVPEGRVNVAGPLLRLNLSFLLRGEGIVGRAAAFPEPTVIESEDIDACRRELFTQGVPNLSLPVALMQQQDTGTGLASVEIGRLEFGAVRCCEIDDTSGSERWSRAGNGEKNPHKDAGWDSSIGHKTLLNLRPSTETCRRFAAIGPHYAYDRLRMTAPGYGKVKATKESPEAATTYCLPWTS